MPETRLRSISDADREIPTLGYKDNAGNEVDLVSGIIHLLSSWDLTSFPALSIYPQVGISRSASETNV